MVTKTETWCDRDEHNLFEIYTDFNEWLESEEGAALREENNIDGLSQPSKVFFVSDKSAYIQAFEEYRKERRHEALNETYLYTQFTDDHWFQRNLDHFNQFVQCLAGGIVVPFVGAGLSVEGGFPSWKDHLRQQGRTAGIDNALVEELLATGQYEAVIEQIENKTNRDVFIQEIRDVFSREGTVTGATMWLPELFVDTLITTNYDQLIEQAYEEKGQGALQIIDGLNALEETASNKITIIKLHGDIKNHTQCILSKNQYNQTYGNDELDLTLPIPRLLSYYYKNKNLLFLGCSLNEDRTMQVFRAVKDKIGNANIPQHFSIEQAPENEDELVRRNAQLAGLGITAIWFEKGIFEYVEEILKLARNELRYRGIS